MNISRIRTSDHRKLATFNAIEHYISLLALYLVFTKAHKTSNFIKNEIRPELHFEMGFEPTIIRNLFIILNPNQAWAI
jgi:hypothetical protein